ncbi:hypothetical protein [Streptomyces atratus]|uniref:hypothetical protein n=1 Tax=Streptomyces atratus TaxID=1893 RepID=UPI003662E656
MIHQAQQAETHPTLSDINAAPDPGHQATGTIGGTGRARTTSTPGTGAGEATPVPGSRPISAVMVARLSGLSR